MRLETQNWIGDTAWPWLNAYGTALGSVVAVVTGVVAVAALLVAVRDSVERSRPTLVAELRSDPYATATQHLVVRNAGPSVAREVRVTFAPPIPDVADPTGLVTPFIAERYSAEIPVLAPGQELWNIWFSGKADSSGGWVNREPLPGTFTVTFSYRGSRVRRYQESFKLTVDLIRKQTYVTSSKDPAEQLKEALKAVPKVVVALQATAAAAELTAEHVETLVKELRDKPRT